MGKKSVGINLDLSDIGEEISVSQQEILKNMQRAKSRSYNKALQNSLKNGLQCVDDNGISTSDRIVSGVISDLINKGCSTNDLVNLMKATGESSEDKVVVTVNLKDELQKISGSEEF